MSVICRFSELQIQTLIVWELITVTDADTDTDFNVFELDMKSFCNQRYWNALFLVPNGCSLTRTSSQVNFMS